MSNSAQVRCSIVEDRPVIIFNEIQDHYEVVPIDHQVAYCGVIALAGEIPDPIHVNDMIVEKPDLKMFGFRSSSGAARRCVISWKDVMARLFDKVTERK